MTEVLLGPDGIHDRLFRRAGDHVARSQARAGRPGCCCGGPRRQSERLGPLGVLVSECLQQAQAAANSLHCTDSSGQAIVTPAASQSPGNAQPGPSAISRSEEKAQGDVYAN